MSESLVGQLFEVEVGPVAHGGHCVARIGGDHGRVVFVRHALPGETARVLVTEDAGGSFCRGDAVQVLVPSPQRVEPPCRYSGPGRCGGCDWQHAAPAAQRELKSAVVAEQLHRLAGLTVAVDVEELPGGMTGWRTRTRYAVAPDGRVGLRRHRSHDVEVVDRCLIGTDGVGNAPELARRFPGAGALEIAASGTQRAVSVHRPVRAKRPVRSRRGARAPERVDRLSGPATLHHRVGEHDFAASALGFWQGHPGAAEAYTAAVMEALAPQAGETALDLYAGAGLFSVPLADAVGQTGRVRALERDARAAGDAERNLAAYPWAEVRRAAVTEASVRALGAADVVVLDPARTGAGRDVVTAVLDSGARAVAYVACDPAAFARDVRTALDAGWTMPRLRAFDAFPMTHHVECVGLLLPPGADVSFRAS